MKKFIILLVAVMGSFLIATAHPVSQEMAKMVASRFMRTNDLQLVSAYKTDKNVTAFYIFNTTDGFVIVSADDCETPIIGYSREGRFDPNNVPVQMEDYLDDFAARIQYGAENHIGADEATARQWESVKTTGKLGNNKDTKSVAPLLTAKWNQGCLYNSLCPTMEGAACGHASVGCVAVAMGQIMHYWGYPASGWGAHSYNNSGASLSADFGNTTYDWNHMPDSLTEASTEAEIEAVATLLYHCGIAVEMNYTNNGSSTSSNNVPEALKSYFSYSKNIHRDKKGNNAEWLTKLKNCLDLQRPILYSGNGNGSHAFVCDGYDENDLLHFNWGWGGDADGYFALGRLNPNGYNFSNNNFAVLDISPDYEPCLVAATVFPTSTGSVEGLGNYHYGSSCTLTATPAEDCEFKFWKKGNDIISYEATLTFIVSDDIDDIEANFTYRSVKEITANPNANPNETNLCMSLYWTPCDTQWTLLKQFDVQDEGENGVATDGEYIYTCRSIPTDSTFMFGKYSMDGAFVEHFNTQPDVFANNLTYDGTFFYCNDNAFSLDWNKKIFCVDLANKTVIDSIIVSEDFYICAYDPKNDGFWLFYVNSVNMGFEIKSILVNRDGQLIKRGPTVPNTTCGASYFAAKDGSPHLLLIMSEGSVFDYNIDNNYIQQQPLMSFNDYAKDGSVGKFDGEDALFVMVNKTIRIYGIKSQFEQVIGYRIYRADSEGNMVMLADGIGGSSYTDTSWGDVAPGDYRFGISSIFANGVESDIVWSDTVVKSGIGIGENPIDPTLPSVQKTIENGHIVIIKDGKRYSLTGQILK